MRDRTQATAAPAERQVRYAKSGDVSIAYQVVGDAELDLMFVPGFFSHVLMGIPDRPGGDQDAGRRGQPVRQDAA